MQISAKHLEQQRAVQHWYDQHAQEFADADVIEMAFVGMSREAQERLNRFKLWAVDNGGNVELAGKHVLELGAGHGRIALAYPEMASYLGVDYSQNLVDIGNQRIERAGLAGHAKLVRGEALSFTSEQRYDVVCSLGMVGYFPEVETIIEAMARFVKPGGSLFFDFRNDSWVYSGIRRIKWLFHPPTSGVAHFTKARRIEAALQRLGFVDVRIVSREFPLLAEHYARSSGEWALNLRNALASSPLVRPLATEAWAFARRP
jgi:2-polyprenyl-3-methyl-5-hydroxy-6-metoxy-1,4-benzoquinol methylase